MLNQKRFFCWVVLGACTATLLLADLAFSGNRWQEKAGPIPIMNQSPIQLLFLQPVPDRAETFPAGHGLIRLNTTLTNTLVSKTSTHYEATLDLEVLRTSLEAAFGVSPWLEVAFSLPFSHYYSGILDGFVQDVENAFGDARGIRDAEQRNTFTYSVKKDGKTVISGSENTTGVGDMALRIKAKVFDQGELRPTLSTRAAVKLPTGRRGRAFGSGEPDWGVGLLLEKDVKKISLYLNADVTFPGEAFDDVGLSLREFYTLLLGVEYNFSPRFSVLSQASFVSRPFEHTGIEILDRRIYELLVGLSYHTKGNQFIQGGIVEDMFDSQDATADVMFFLNVGMNF